MAEQTNTALTLTDVLEYQQRNRAALARELGVSKATFHAWEHGRNCVPESAQQRIADKLGLPRHVLFDDEGRAR